MPLDQLFSPIPVLLMLLRVQKSLEFRDIINTETFVDKTLLLYDFFDDLSSSVRQFVSCPPGFGKTTILRMIDLFSSLEFDSDNIIIEPPNTTRAFELFNRTRIASYGKFLNGNVASYVVLTLDMDNKPQIDTYTRALAYDFVYDVLIEAFSSRFSSLLNENRLSHSEKVFLQELRERSFDPKEIPCLLGYLIKMLHDYFEKPVLLLIDNYDLPLKRCVFAADANPRVDILYDVFNELIFYASKYPRNYLQRIMIMSTTTIPFNWHDNRTSTFHLHEFAVKNAYEKYLGFTEIEIKQLMNKWKLKPAERKELREFYMAPFVHYESNIYNPRSIVSWFKYREALKTNRTVHLGTYQSVLDDFKSILRLLQGTEFEQKLLLLSCNQSIWLPDIWIGDRLSLSRLKNVTTGYKDFVTRAFVWIYMLEWSYITYSMDGIGFQLASPEIMYLLRESLYENFDRTRISFDKIGHSLVDFVDLRVIQDNKSMSNSVSRFEHYLQAAFKNINSSEQVHPQEATFAAVILISSHVSVEMESSMVVSAVEIRSNLTIGSARYDIYCHRGHGSGKKKLAVVLGLRSYTNSTKNALEQVEEQFVVPAAQRRFIEYLTYMAVCVDSQMNVRIEYATRDASFLKNSSGKDKITKLQ